MALQIQKKKVDDKPMQHLFFVKVKLCNFLTKKKNFCEFSSCLMISHESAYKKRVIR